MSTTKDYVKWFRNSAPYINAHRGKTFVLMFEGEAIEDPNFPNIIHDIALLNSLGVKLVIIHGARAQIDNRCQRYGITSKIENDIRVTDKETLECVKDAVGSLRSQIEALLTMGLANSPMHGADIRVCSGNFVIAKPLGVLNGTDYEHTGLVRRMDTDAINQQLNDNGIVLLSTLGYSPTGEIFNLSLDDVTINTVKSIEADKLICFSERQGLFDFKGNFLKECDLSSAIEILPKDNDINGRQLINAIIKSCENGINRCHALSYKEDGALLQELFSRDGTGTLIYQDDYDQLRTATINDVGGILELIEPLEEDGTLLKRSREQLEMEIDHFIIIERDGMIVSCAALFPYPDIASAEIACVVTHPDYRGQDRGERLMSAIQMKAISMQIDHLFVLTTVTAHWFQEQGFTESDLSALPESKKELYNYQRNSKVFRKTI